MASPSAPQGPMRVPREHYTKVAVEWVCDVGVAQQLSLSVSHCCSRCELKTESAIFFW